MVDRKTPYDKVIRARQTDRYPVVGRWGRTYPCLSSRVALPLNRDPNLRTVEAREGMEVPDDIHTSLLTVAETTDSRSAATGALNVLVETGEISDMEALDRLDDWKDKLNR